jgi:hypothetical protein
MAAPGDLDQAQDISAQRLALGKQLQRSHESTVYAGRLDGTRRVVIKAGHHDALQRELRVLSSLAAANRGDQQSWRGHDNGKQLASHTVEMIGICHQGQATGGSNGPQASWCIVLERLGDTLQQLLSPAPPTAASEQQWQAPPPPQTRNGKQQPMTAAALKRLARHLLLALDAVHG